MLAFGPECRHDGSNLPLRKISRTGLHRDDAVRAEIDGSSRLSGEETQRRPSRPSQLREFAGREPTKALVRACMAPIPLQCRSSAADQVDTSPQSNAEGQIDRTAARGHPIRAQPVVEQATADSRRQKIEAVGSSTVRR